jgi:hypothetical protein
VVVGRGGRPAAVEKGSRRGRVVVRLCRRRRLLMAAELALLDQLVQNVARDAGLNERLQVAPRLDEDVCGGRRIVHGGGGRRVVAEAYSKRVCVCVSGWVRLGRLSLVAS